MIVLPVIEAMHYSQFVNLCPELPETHAGWLAKVSAWKRHYREPEYRVQWTPVSPEGFRDFITDGSKPNNLNSLLAFAEVTSERPAVA